MFGFSFVTSVFRVKGTSDHDVTKTFSGKTFRALRGNLRGITLPSRVTPRDFISLTYYYRLFRYKCHRWIFFSLFSNCGGNGKLVRLIVPIFRKTRPPLQRITETPWRRRKAVPSEILENIFLYCVISLANQFVYDPFLAEFGRSASPGSPEADFRCHFGHFLISLLATYK